MSARLNAASACVFLVAACAGTGCEREVPAAEVGAERFRDPAVSTSPFNRFSCATCHAADPAAPPVVPGRFDSGYNLGHTVWRGAWWGRDRVRLLDAINVCVEQMMGGRALAADEPVARELYEFLLRQSPAMDAGAGPLPLTVPAAVADLRDLVGDATRGREVWRRGCERCHGAARTGAGRIDPRATIVPDDTIATFGLEARAAVVEKLRHGRYFGIGGVMPFYAKELLEDQAIADLLVFLGL